MLFNHMIESNVNLDNILKAISDPVRRQILSSLRAGPKTVGQIAGPYDMSFAGAAKHVNILVNANLVQKAKSGRQQICTLNVKPLESLQNWLESYSGYWGDRLGALDIAVKEFDDGK